jgi:hypothetical protein
MQFWKYVIPGTQCGVVDGEESCYYTNSISAISLYQPYLLQPSAAPEDSAHELLFEIDMISGVTSECLPYLEFQSIPAPDPVPWNGASIGAPVNAPLGFGQPSVFLTLNHVLQASPNGMANFNDALQPWQQGTTLAELYSAVALGNVGAPYTFTYSSTSATSGSTVQWYPDFAGCDVAADPGTPGVEYGISGVQILFQIYQATP